jgi:cytochrome c oxidase cbb3-type subunit 3
MSTNYGNLMEHSYDGIQEYDNPTPGWWHALWAGTIVFSVLYSMWFHLSPAAPSIWEKHAARQLEEIKKQYAEIGELKPDEPTILKMMQNEKWKSVGASVFKTNCVSCHGEKGQGQVGPNLTDDHYKNVKHLADIASVIEKGAAAGAMPAWKGRLHPNDIVLVSAYVASLRGQNLTGPRGAEGDKIDPWPAAPAPDAAPAPAASPPAGTK